MVILTSFGFGVGFSFLLLQSNLTYSLRTLHSDRFIFLSQFRGLTGLAGQFLCNLAW